METGLVCWCDAVFQGPARHGLCSELVPSAALPLHGKPGELRWLLSVADCGEVGQDFFTGAAFLDRKYCFIKWKLSVGLCQIQEKLYEERFLISRTGTGSGKQKASRIWGSAQSFGVYEKQQ